MSTALADVRPVVSIDPGLDHLALAIFHPAPRPGRLGWHHATVAQKAETLVGWETHRTNPKQSQEERLASIADMTTDTLRKHRVARVILETPANMGNYRRAQGKSWQGAAMMHVWLVMGAVLVGCGRAGVTPDRCVPSVTKATRHAMVRASLLASPHGRQMYELLDKSPTGLPRPKSSAEDVWDAIAAGLSVAWEL